MVTRGWLTHYSRIFPSTVFEIIILLRGTIDCSCSFSELIIFLLNNMYVLIQWCIGTDFNNSFLVSNHPMVFECSSTHNNNYGNFYEKIAMILIVHANLY